MVELLARPLADAFMQVGVFVAVLVALFGWLRWRYGDRVTDGLTRRPRLGPLVGALLGVSPGCGGAIILMPLYARGKVSFGTVVAALAATMGDSSWLVIAADPAFALRIHLLLFVVGLVTGYAVDLLGIDPARALPAWWRRVRRQSSGGSGRPADPAPVDGGVRPVPAPVSASRVPAPAAGPDGVGSFRPNAVGSPGRSAVVVPVGSGGGGVPVRSAGVAPAGVAALATLPVVDRRPVERKRTMSVAFWGLTTPAFLISVPIAFHLVDPTLLRVPFGGIDPYLALGCAGTLVALLIFAVGRGRFADDTVETAHPTSLRETLRHSAHEASFVTVWVAVAYLGWQILSTATGFDGSQLGFAGVLGVLVGALVGLIPGCAIQIVFTGIYISGGLPLPTLVANAISQDGDALIPLAALRRRAAGLATLITTVPAILVGLGVLLFLTL
ncbi:putative manganese transporter [Plantactinospora sonchi]|uniref:Manganese transporter n=1 Tax=Plantactinospora sonchi TaxID=1544735 RepID=A0ABU7RLR2_9ACTN